MLHNGFHRRSNQRALTLSTACLLVSLANAGDARAQLAGLIRVHYEEAGLFECSVHDAGPSLRTVVALLTLNGGAQSVRFRIEPSPGMTMALVSEEHHFASTLGDVSDGITICFGPCVLGNQRLVTMTYMAFGTSETCSFIQVAPHPEAQTVEQIDCLGSPRTIPVQDLVVERSVADCLCPGPRGVPGTPTLFDCVPLSVARSTWGAIKALYR